MKDTLTLTISREIHVSVYSYPGTIRPRGAPLLPRFSRPVTSSQGSGATQGRDALASAMGGRDRVGTARARGCDDPAP